MQKRTETKFLYHIQNKHNIHDVWGEGDDTSINVNQKLKAKQGLIPLSQKCFPVTILS